jgi:flagellar hook-associated protein 1
LIEVNPAVDPSQGGNPNLIRDGVNFDFNAAANGGVDQASFSTQLENILNNLNANQTFSASGGIATSNTISGYASASVSWLEAQRQNNSNETTFQSTLLANTTSAFTNATGVSLDSELSKMLDLEQSYSASAQLMTTVNTMFNSLITSVQTAAGNAG